MNAIVDKIIAGHDLRFNLEFQCDEESGWIVVHVVELPGCVSQGATIEEAKANVANALESYLDVLLETAIRNQAPQGKSLDAPVGETSVMLVRPRFEVRA
jgi:predicted RNase H-like HicB family nuclease